MVRSLIVGTCVAVAAGSVLTSARSWRGEGPDDAKPLVVGHRGASGYLPEHTLASYQLAIEQGADYIEPDLVSTKDGVLIARHEVNIANTTDVAAHPEFRSRRTTKTIDGIPEEGWFADDFTLAEIKTLRALQPSAFRPQQFSGVYTVPTFSEVLELAIQARVKGREIGVYPETKHPTYHKSKGLALEPKLLATLQRYGLNRRKAPVFIQSFEVANLKMLNRMTDVRLIQLIDGYDTLPDGTIDVDRAEFRPFDAPYDFTLARDPRRYVDLVTPAGLQEISTYADGIGPWKRYIVGAKIVDGNGDGRADDLNGDGTINDADKTAVVTSLIEDAHQADLLVHAFTFRNEARRYLLSDYNEVPAQEYLHFYCMGLDGLFSDFPDTAVTARTLLWRAQRSCQPFRP